MRSMALLVISLFFLGGLAAVPTVSALPTCGNDALTTIGSYHVQYVIPRSKVWEETNGLGGLQTQQCTKNGVTYQPDTLRAGIPQDLGILGICATLSVVSQCF